MSKSELNIKAFILLSLINEKEKKNRDLFNGESKENAKEQRSDKCIYKYVDWKNMYNHTNVFIDRHLSIMIFDIWHVWRKCDSQS